MHHFEEILNYWDHRFTNATLEGLNSIIQNIKVRARGFRNDQYFITTCKSSKDHSKPRNEVDTSLKSPV